MVKNNITAIVIVLGALMIVALAVIIYLFMRTRRVELECELLLRGSDGTNFVEIVNDNIAQVHGLLDEVDALSERYAAVLRRVAGAVQHVGVVRFDAFRDLGGLLSFAIAMLDDRGNGLVFSSIYGRSESRTYAKPVIERSSSYELSPEEREAIRLALQSKELGALPMEAKDHDHEERMANLRLFHDREYLAGSPEREGRVEPAETRVTREQRERPEPRPARRPVEEPERAAPEPSTKRRRAGRATHVAPAERDTRESEPVEELAPPTGASLEEQVERLLEPESDYEPEPRGVERRTGASRLPRAQTTTDRSAPPPKRPTTPRPRGLDTPVDRLRNKEPE